MSNVRAETWLQEARRNVAAAKQSLQRVYDAAVQAKADLAGIPHGYTVAASRRFIEAGGRTSQLEEAEDECVRLINKLHELDFSGLESCEVDKFERWAAEARGEGL